MKKMTECLTNWVDEIIQSVNAIYVRFLKAKYKKRLKHQKRYLEINFIRSRSDWSFSSNPQLYIYLKLKDKFRQKYDAKFIYNYCK